MDIPIEIHISMPEGTVTIHGYLDSVATHREELTFRVDGRLRPKSFWVAKGTGNDYARHHVRPTIVQTGDRTLSGSLAGGGKRREPEGDRARVGGTFGASGTLTIPIGPGSTRPKKAPLTKRQARRKRSNEKRREYKKPASPVD